MEEQFLADVRESPEDDGPRLIYADWLDDHGDPDRARFIRAQCELERLPAGGPSRWKLWQLAEGLRREHVMEWLPFRVPGWAAWQQPFWFRRGLVEGVGLNAEDLLNHGETIFRAYPTLRHVGLHSVGDAWPRLIRSPVLRHVRQLDVDGDYGRAALGADAVAALAASPHLERLAGLHLDYHAAGDAGLAALAGAPGLGNLRVLALRGNGITDAGAQALAESPHLLRLAELYLHDNRFGDPAALALGAWPGLARLTHLDLGLDLRWGEPGPPRLGPAGATALAAAPLRHLDLEGHAIGDEGLEALAAGPALAGLEGLVLGHRRRGEPPPLLIGDRGALAIAASPYLSRLVALELSGHQVGDLGVRLLADSPNVARLDTLDLWGNLVGDAGARALAGSPYLANLRRLNLVANQLTDAGGLALASWPRGARLGRLNLYPGFSGPVDQALRDRFGGDVNLDERKYYDFWNG